MGRKKLIEDDAVLAIARDFFGREGHSGSTRAIAEQVGVSQAVLFQRFGSKEALFFRAMTPPPLDLEAVLGPYPPADVAADLLALARRVSAYMRSSMSLLLKVLAFPDLDSQRLSAWHAQLPFLPLLDAMAARFERLAQDGLVDPGDAHARAVAFIAGLHSLSFFEQLSTPRERAHHHASVESFVQVLWHGLAPAAPRAGSARRGARAQGAKSASSTISIHTPRSVRTKKLRKP